MIKYRRQTRAIIYLRVVYKYLDGSTNKKLAISPKMRIINLLPNSMLLVASVSSYNVNAFAPQFASRKHLSITLRYQNNPGASSLMRMDAMKSDNEITAPLQKSFTAFALACTLFFSPSVELLPDTFTPIIQNPIALAADYGSLTDEQKAVAEAWRIVDNSFFDRTFNNQDWFKVRQDSVKKKYKDMGEAQAEIEKIVSSLGDKYTRYLTPAKYRSIVDAATGTLAGVGVEISSNKETGTIFVADTEPSSPASNGQS